MILDLLISDLAYPELALRGDAEHSLQCLLHAVANRVNSRSQQKVKVESSAPGHHQSIGLAENSK